MADLVITPDDVRVQQSVTARGVLFDSAVTPGVIVYPTATGSYDLAACGDIVTSNAAGIVLTVAGAGEWGFIFTNNATLFDIGATTVEGEVYVVSANAGLIAVESDLTSGQYLTVIGYGDGGLLRWQPNATGLAKA